MTTVLGANVLARCFAVISLEERNAWRSSHDDASTDRLTTRSSVWSYEMYCGLYLPARHEACEQVSHRTVRQIECMRNEITQLDVPIDDHLDNQLDDRTDD